MRSRASFFKHYVSHDRLDEPVAEFDQFSLPKRKLLCYLSWNVETFIGVGKYEHFQAIAKTLPLGFYCLQETKGQNPDVLRYPYIHFYLSGSRSDLHAGVGFAIPTPLLPLEVHGFHPLDSRLAVLILNTCPTRVALFTVYAPSQLSDSAQDQSRKERFWHQLHQLFSHYSSQYIPILMGDFNSRLSPNFTQSLPDLFGSSNLMRIPIPPPTFSTSLIF